MYISLYVDKENRSIERDKRIKEIRYRKKAMKEDLLIGIKLKEIQMNDDDKALLWDRRRITIKKLENLIKRYR